MFSTANIRETYKFTGVSRGDFDELPFLSDELRL